MTEKDYTGKKVAFCTLGCKLNFSETSSIARKFEELGFERVEYKELPMYMSSTPVRSLLKATKKAVI